MLTMDLRAYLTSGRPGRTPARIIFHCMAYLFARPVWRFNVASVEPAKITSATVLSALGNIWLRAIIIVGMIDAIAVFKDVDYSTLLPGAIVGGATIAYIAINHAGNEIWETIPLKEFAIGSLFATGTLVGVTPHIFAMQSTIIPAAILFATLCWLNCVSIAIWERNLDRAQGRHSIATLWRDVNLLVRVVFPILLIRYALLVVLDFVLLPIAFCLATSGLLLGALYFA